MIILVKKIYETLSTSGIRMQASFNSGPAAARFFLLFNSEREKKAREKWQQKATRAKKKRKEEKRKSLNGIEFYKPPHVWLVMCLILSL